MGSNRYLTKIVAMLLAVIMMPSLASAVTEDTIEAAPEIQLEIVTESKISYLPDASYYVNSSYLDGLCPDWAESETYVEMPIEGDQFIGLGMQYPSLTSGEQKRALRLKEQYDAGILTYNGPSILNLRENVIVGVYEINPADYDGEVVYVLLPYCCLSDSNLLAIIDAYHHLGLNFDPASLNYRNCMRGGDLEATRVMTSDERDRNNRIRQLIQNGMLTQDQIASDAALYEVSLDPQYFNGLAGYRMYPYRCMNDDELAVAAFVCGVKDQSHSFDFQSSERLARNAMHRYMDIPLSVASGRITQRDVNLTYWDESANGEQENREGNSGYDVLFSWNEDAVPCTVHVTMVDRGQGYELDSILWDHDIWGISFDDSIYPAHTDAERLSAVHSWVNENVCLDGVDSLVWFVKDEAYLSCTDDCMQLTAVNDDWILDATIFRNSLQMHSFKLVRNHPELAGTYESPAYP